MELKHKHGRHYFIELKGLKLQKKETTVVFCSAFTYKQRTAMLAHHYLSLQQPGVWAFYSVVSEGEQLTLQHEAA